MHVDIRELLQRKADAVSAAKDLVANAEKNKRSLTADERREVDGLTDYARELNVKIEEAQEKREEQRTAAAVRTARDLQKGAILRNTDKMADVMLSTPEERKMASDYSIGRLIRGIVTGNWDGADLERRGLSSGTPSAGGFFIPSPVAASVLDTARAQSVCIGLGANTVPMTTSNLTMVKIDDDPTTYWRGENAAITEDDTMAFGAMKFEAKALGCLVRTSIELLEDAANADQVIMQAMGSALALELDRAALVGTGEDDDQPLGIFNTTGVQFVEMGGDGAPIVGYRKLVDSAAQVMASNGVPTGFVYAPRTWAQIENSLSGEGQFVHIPPGIAGMQFKVSNQIPVDMEYGSGTPADDASAIFCGGWNNLYFGMRTQIVIEATRFGGAEAFSKMQVLIRAYLRADVQVARANQFSIIRGIVPAV